MDQSVKSTIMTIYSRDGNYTYILLNGIIDALATGLHIFTKKLTEGTVFL